MSSRLDRRCGNIPYVCPRDGVDRRLSSSPTDNGRCGCLNRDYVRPDRVRLPLAARHNRNRKRAGSRHDYAGRCHRRTCCAWSPLPFSSV
jgi:hypothetical protein